MFNRRIRVILGILGIWACFTAGAMGQAPQPAQPPVPEEGVEVQARGPIHEAFAEPVAARPLPGPVAPKQPPEPLEELPPEQKPEGENVQWIPGYWTWDEDRNDFLWVSGFWRVPPPDRQWVPGSWSRTAAGWQWSPGYWALPQAQEIQFLPPPPEPVETGPSVPAPAADHVYVNGCWVWHGSRYLWRPGYWLPYRPGFVWIPAHYVWTPAGCIFVHGYWDYDLARRGVLFAPVYVPRHVWSRPHWVYRPRFTVHLDCLWGALWVRPSCRHYYFGDYYDPLYQRRGFTAWIDFRFGRHGYDPLFSYYRHHFARERHWERDLRQVYVGRARGTLVRPPRTLVQQTTLLQNLNVRQNTTRITNVHNVTVLTPLTQQVAAGNRRFRNLTEDRLREEQRRAQQLHDVSRQRNQQEAKVLAARAAPVRTSDPPRVLKLDLPQPGARGGRQTAPATPPRTQVPPQPGKPPRATVQPQPGRPSLPTIQPHPGTSRPAPRIEPPKPSAPPKFQPAPRSEPPRSSPPPRPDGRIQPFRPPVTPPKVEPRPTPPSPPSRDVRPQPVPQPVQPPATPPRAQPQPVQPPVTPPRTQPQPVAPLRPEPRPSPVPSRIAPQPQPARPVQPLRPDVRPQPRTEFRPPMQPLQRFSPQPSRPQPPSAPPARLNQPFQPPRIERTAPRSLGIRPSVPPGKSAPPRSEDKDKKNR